MKIKHTWIDSIDKRKSRRTYIDEDLRETEVSPILYLIDDINRNTGFNIKYISDCKDGLSGFKASYGMISGVKSFIALVGNKDIKNYKEWLGYYGEMLVLEASSLNLGTCWIGGTFNRDICESKIIKNHNEELVCIIAIGHVKDYLSHKEKLIKGFSKKESNLEDILIHSDKDIEPWIEAGMKSVIKAPSALNKKPVKYKWEDNKIKAFVDKSNYGYECIDLGITLLHFQVGALSKGYEGSWIFSNGEWIYE